MTSARICVYRDHDLWVCTRLDSCSKCRAELQSFSARPHSAYENWKGTWQVLQGVIDCQRMTRNVYAKVISIVHVNESLAELSAFQVLWCDLHVPISNYEVTCRYITTGLSTVWIRRQISWVDWNQVERQNPCKWLVDTSVLPSFPELENVQMMRETWDNRLTQKRNVLSKIPKSSSNNPLSCKNQETTLQEFEYERRVTRAEFNPALVGAAVRLPGLPEKTRFKRPPASLGGGAHGLHRLGPERECFVSLQKRTSSGQSLSCARHGRTSKKCPPTSVIEPCTSAARGERTRAEHMLRHALNAKPRGSCDSDTTWDASWRWLMLVQATRISAFALARNVCFSVRWVPAEWPLTRLQDFRNAITPMSCFVNETTKTWHTRGRHPLLTTMTTLLPHFSWQIRTSWQLKRTMKWSSWLFGLESALSLCAVHSDTMYGEEDAAARSWGTMPASTGPTSKRWPNARTVLSLTHSRSTPSGNRSSWDATLSQRRRAPWSVSSKVAGVPYQHESSSLRWKPAMACVETGATSVLAQLGMLNKLTSIGAGRQDPPWKCTSAVDGHR